MVVYGFGGKLINFFLAVYVGFVGNGCVLQTNPIHQAAANRELITKIFIWKKNLFKYKHQVQGRNAILSTIHYSPLTIHYSPSVVLALYGRNNYGVKNIVNGTSPAQIVNRLI